MTRATAADITVVTVAYNSAEVLPQMLASVPDGTPVVVVDNASKDDSAALAETHGATVVHNPENRGFGMACNLGAAETGTEFILFLNPDATLTEGALDALLGAAASYPDAGAFNPRIADRNGKPYLKRRSALLPKADHLPRGWPEADRQVPVLSGSAIFLRKAAFDAVGGFDERIFLYHEDDDLSLRLAAQVGPLWFVRDALVVHMEGRSSARTPESAAFKAYHLGRSGVYSKRKHGRPMPFVSSIWGAVLQLITPDVLLSSRRRAKALGLLKGVWSMRGGREI